MNETEKILNKLSPTQLNALTYFAENGAFKSGTTHKVRSRLVVLDLVKHEHYKSCPTCACTPDGDATLTMLTPLGEAVVKVASPDLKPLTKDPYLWWVPTSEEPPKWGCAGCGKREWQQLGARFWCGNCGTMQYADDAGIHVVMPEMIAEVTKAVDRFDQAKAATSEKNS